jgi:hypothetical protein
MIKRASRKLKNAYILEGKEYIFVLQPLHHPYGPIACRIAPANHNSISSSQL